MKIKAHLIDPDLLLALLLADQPNKALMESKIIDCHMRDGKVSLIVESEFFDEHGGSWCSAPVIE